MARRILSAVNDRDIAALQDCLHPGVVWHEMGADNALGGPFEGIGEVLTFFARAFETTGDSFTIEAHDVLASDDHAVVLVNESGTRAGLTMYDRGVYVAHFSEGKVSEVWNYSEDLTSHNRFWA
jgi:ketosteroid isomerase-like protein